MTTTDMHESYLWICTMNEVCSYWPVPFEWVKSAERIGAPLPLAGRGAEQVCLGTQPTWGCPTQSLILQKRKFRHSMIKYHTSCKEAGLTIQASSQCSQPLRSIQKRLPHPAEFCSKREELNKSPYWWYTCWCCVWVDSVIAQLACSLHVTAWQGPHGVHGHLCTWNGHCLVHLGREDLLPRSSRTLQPERVMIWFFWRNKTGDLVGDKHG